MRNPNGYGCIRKLSGKRKRPYGVYITTEFTIAPSVPDIGFLAGILTPDLYNQVEKQYEAYKGKQIPQARQKQKCIGYYETRPDAMIALAEYNKNPFDIDKRNTTFGQIYEILLKEKFNKMKTSTRATYVTAYRYCDSIANIRMVDLRKAHMQKIVDDNSDKSKSTLNNLLKIFHAVYKFAMENDICEKNYSEFVTAESEKEVKQKAPFSREEIETLWDNINWVCNPKKPKTTSGKPYIDMVLIHIYTGIRPGELFKLKKCDIHLEERWIDVGGTKTKAAKRIVPIHKKILPLLEKRMHGESEYLFTSGSGKPFESTVYRNSFFDPMCSHFGMNHTPHECRHTFASFAAASNMNKVLVKKIIGHSSGDLTEDVYTHAFIEDLVEEIDKMNM